MFLYHQSSAECPTYCRYLMKDIFYFLKMKTNIFLTDSIKNFALHPACTRTRVQDSAVLAKMSLLFQLNYDNPG